MMSTPMFGRQRVRRFKHALRRYVPPRYWSGVRRVMRSTLHGLADATATIAATTLRVLPDAVSIALRERITLRRPLDYDKARLTLQVTSLMERDLRLRSCEKEPETIEWIHSTIGAGDVLYDVGANVGAYSLVAASWTGGRATVYAFEPGYRTFVSLVENVLANGFDESITPFQVALTDHTAISPFEYSTTEAGAASHGGIRGRRDGRLDGLCQPVLSYRLDEFVRVFGLRPPTHIKIDVDGSELRVLRGAGELLKCSSLRWVLVEVDEDQSDISTVRTLLEGSGLRLERDEPHLGGRVRNWLFERHG